VADAIKLLETDHREVEELFAKAESTSGAAKAQVVAKICDELTVHADVEERVVYPAMREAGLDDLVTEAEQEHGQVKELLAKLEGDGWLIGRRRSRRGRVEARRRAPRPGRGE
jgi:hemerythrin superfamily protein